MGSIDAEVNDYLEWMAVHNYAATTIGCRRRYLDYFVAFAHERGVEEIEQVDAALLVSYQHQLFAHRKHDGKALSFGTQAQRLVPVTQLFAWLRREHRLALDPAAELLMPRPDRRLPEATLSTAEMAALLSAPDVGTPLGLRDRAVLEVFYSTGLRRGELIALALRDVDFERGTLFVRSGKGAKDRYVPIGERALFWVRLSIGLVRPGFVAESATDTLFVSSAGTPLCADWLCRRVRAYLAKAGIANVGAATYCATPWPP